MPQYYFWICSVTAIFDTLTFKRFLMQNVLFYTILYRSVWIDTFTWIKKTEIVQFVLTNYSSHKVIVALESLPEIKFSSVNDMKTDATSRELVSITLQTLNWCSFVVTDAGNRKKILYNKNKPLHSSFRLWHFGWFLTHSVAELKCVIQPLEISVSPLY